MAAPALRATAVFALLAVLTGCASEATPATAPAAASLGSLPGSAWRLVQVTSGSKTISLPRTERAELDFGHDGNLLVDDTVNALSARYTIDGAGFTTSDSASTAVGYAGTDPTRVMTIAAVDSIVYEFKHGASRPTTHIAARRSGAVLHIVSSRFALTYARVGTYTDPPTPSSTRTRP